MTQVERVAQMFSTSAGQEAFIAWAGSEVTQLMLSAAREIAAPAQPQLTDPGTVALAMGRTLGATMVVDYLSNPYRMREEEQMATEYGAGQILKEAGYGNADS